VPLHEPAGQTEARAEHDAEQRARQPQSEDRDIPGAAGGSEKRVPDIRGGRRCGVIGRSMNAMAIPRPANAAISTLEKHFGVDQQLP
jgi:hypothetical protein